VVGVEVYAANNGVTGEIAVAASAVDGFVAFGDEGVISTLAIYLVEAGVPRSSSGFFGDLTVPAGALNCCRLAICCRSVRGDDR